MQSRAKRLAIFHQLGIGVPARSALVRALLVLGFGGLNEPEPHRLSALGTRPKCERLRRWIPKRFWHLQPWKGDSDFTKATQMPRHKEIVISQGFSLGPTRLRGYLRFATGRVACVRNILSEQFRKPLRATAHDEV
jgi:hypothetical protein